jgi:transposase
MQQPDILSAEEVAYLEHLRTDEQVADLYDLAQTFCRMVRDRDVECLDVWLGAASTNSFRDLRGFAVHLQQDHAAVRGALSLPWSNGQTEGQITRLKLLKRQMYGRANLDLLKRRFLHRA